MQAPSTQPKDPLSREYLSQCFRELLAFETPGQQLAAAQDLYATLTEITGLLNEDFDNISKQEIVLSCGKAISPSDAARCVLDFARTARFIHGILLALAELQRSISNRPIEIVYAGCGPFAPLALAIADRFSCDAVQLTLLDVHQWSLNCAERVFEHFGFLDRVKAFVCCDAASYRHEGDDLDMVIAETMQRALTKEPQVEVVTNLAPQLSPHGILIPEQVRVDVQLAELAHEFGQAETLRRRIMVGTLLDLTSDLCRRASAEPGVITNARVLAVPMTATPQHCTMLTTYVRVFGCAELNDYDSGITYPMVLDNLTGAQPSDRLEFNYRIGSNPGFSYRVLAPEESGWNNLKPSAKIRPSGT